LKTIKEKLIKLLSLKKSPDKLHQHLDANAELTVELAKIFIQEIQSSYSTWESAYLRIDANEDSIGCRISCKRSTQIELLDVLQHKSFTNAVIEIGSQLRECTPSNGKKFLVLLLVIENNFNYEIQYEYENSNRWAITKLGGGTGVPVGYNPA
jgi:hypothetical protein